MDAGAASPHREVAAVGPGVAFAMLAGVAACFTMPWLPPWPLSLAAAAAVAATGMRRTRWRPACALAFGFLWTAVHGQLALQARLPEHLVGQELAIQGTVVGLPRSDEGRQRFDLAIERAASAPEIEGRRVRLSWYGRAPLVLSGARWHLQVRLKRPRGVQNPGGFDFERHALERRLAATGYVREGPANRRLDAARGIDAWRAGASARMHAVLGPADARFVAALAVGDTRALSQPDWEVLRATGTTHLFAISGFHVGLVAGFAVLLLRALYRLWPQAGLHLPLPPAAAVAGLAGAAGYAALAGYELPAVRTVLMIAVAVLAIALRRAASSWQVFALALAAVLLADPLAPLGAGFWLSFVGVAWLLLCMPRAGTASPGRLLLRAQGVATVGLLPLTVWFFGQASIVGALANLVAVPWISLVVVPLCLAGTGLAAVAEAAGAWGWYAAAWAMRPLWWLLERAASLDGALVYLPEPGPAALLAAAAGALWLLLPRALPGKPLACLLWLPLLLPARSAPLPGELELEVLDVGQGLAVLLRTASSTLVYDAGPAFPEGLDHGHATVVPAIHALAHPAPQALVLSHADNDHAGGSGSLRRAFAPLPALSGEPRRAGLRARCRAGEHWWRDGVRFDWLHPPRHFPELGNDSSCVLRIRAAGGAVLLPGDISTAIESRLLSAGIDLRAQVLLVPHHGSRSSSSPAFIEAVGPRLAIASAGHGNRFGHPAAEVQARYLERGAHWISTAQAGAVTVRLQRDGRILVRQRRKAVRRFWHER
ncbi:MAG TPA: DNA internalization-related competence protein ComEC/Rec2 [Xanthomonadaceae bacterium]|nr:DNA internalization-related competence protein ComEC/Rec2 [Xanthomonadaceae bacterium]